MKEIFTLYINSLLHPFSTHRDLFLAREKEYSRKGNLQLIEEEVKEEPLSFLEVMSVSWGFKMLATFYAMASIHLGIQSFKFMTGDDDYSNIFFNDFPQKAQQLLLIYTILGAIFYPIIMWAYTKFWSILIGFFVNLFEKDEVSTKGIHDVVNYSLISNAFLAIPIFGGMAKSISGMIYIFAGLRKNMNFSVSQSLIILISPAFIMFVLFLMIAVNIMLIVNVL